MSCFLSRSGDLDGQSRHGKDGISEIVGSGADMPCVSEFISTSKMEACLAATIPASWPLCAAAAVSKCRNSERGFATVKV